MGVINKTLSLKSIPSLDLIDLKNLAAFFKTLNSCKDMYIDFEGNLNKVVDDSQGNMVCNGVDYMGAYMDSVAADYKKIISIFSSISEGDIMKKAKQKNEEIMHNALLDLISKGDTLDNDIQICAAKIEKLKQGIYFQQDMDNYTNKLDSLKAQREKVRQDKETIRKEQQEESGY